MYTRPARFTEQFEVNEHDKDVLEVMLAESGRGQGGDGRVQARAWCDCPQNQKLNGVTDRRIYNTAGNFFETEVDDDGICQHCGYFAVYSIKDPTNGRDEDGGIARLG